MKFLLAAGFAALAATAQAPSVSQQLNTLLTANGLKADVSFLASDLLEGRGTPSRGLDLAAEYIAAQFRRAGLEPVGDDGYFQTAGMLQLTPDPEGFEMKFRQGETVLAVPRNQAVPRVSSTVDLTDTPVFRFTGTDTSGLKRDQVKGCAIVLDTVRGARRILAELQKLEPAAIIR